jgi:organic hydroperoxide reductase OsmC/OhrA
MDTYSLHTCAIEWSGDTLDYAQFSRLHQISFPGGQSVSGGPGGKAAEGVAAYTNPEELFAAAVGTCMMMTILAVFSKAQVNVVAYSDHPVAVLEFIERRFRVTKVTLKPQLTVQGNIDEGKFENLVQKAHANCFIGVSVKSEITIVPSYKTA